MSSVRDLSYRLTDLFVRDAAGLWPLSVSTDRIGIVAFRAARLLADLEAEAFFDRHDPPRMSTCLSAHELFGHLAGGLAT